MFISAAHMAHACTGMHQVEPSSYVTVQLGSHKGTAIKEYAHRIVLWAMHGPPLDLLATMGGWTSAGPHCLHVCGNKDCLNPSHLVWGSAGDNKADDELVYLALLEQQGRG
jgi:hypothetical protein